MKATPKYKICRRLGSGIYDKCQSEKYTLAESKKAQNRKRGGRRRNISNFNLQLLEKQKIRFTYGITEKQFRKYVKEAQRSKEGETSRKLLLLLESRLDNVIYRMGLAPTRRAARQLVAHGHILVEGRKMKIPSYMVGVGEKVSIREGSRNKPVFEHRLEEMEKLKLPTWLIYDVKKYEGSVKDVPAIDDLLSNYNVTSVIEFYSR